MARARIIANVTNVTPDARAYQFSVRDAVVNIYERGTTDEPTVYTTEAGGTTVTGPFTTDSAGRVIHDDSSELWVVPQSLDLDITGVSDPVPVEPISAQDLGGRELGYAQITTIFATSGTHTTAQDVTGLTTTVTVGTRPIIVEFGCAQMSHSSNGGITVLINEGATVLTAATLEIGTANKGAPGYCRVRLTPTAGSHTYKIQAKAQTTNATCSIAADALFPAWIQVTEV